MARPMTMAEKILAAHAGLEEVVPGQLIECDLDLVLSNDVTAPIAIKEFKKVGVDKVFDPTKIALVPIVIPALMAHWALLLPVLVLPMLLLVMQLVKLGLRFLSQSCLMLKDSFSLALLAKTLFCISLV